MLIRRGGGRVERLGEGGPVLGLLPTVRYQAGRVEIDAADTLVLYSDGINEAANQSGEEFGEDRITQIISSAAPGAAPEETCERIMRHVHTFARSGAPADDQTLMLVRFRESGLESAKLAYGEVNVAA